MFGHRFKEKHFTHFDPKLVPVNHGAYGAAPTCVVDKYFSELRRDFSNTDRYLNKEQRQVYEHSRDEMAKVLKCDPKNLALIANATTGVNIVLRSFPFSKGDKIAMPSTTFSSCASTVKFLKEYQGVEFVIVDLELPMADVDVLSAFRHVFETHEIRLALFDAVVSFPAAKMPYVELAQLCRDFDVVSVVDGAHSAGLVPVDFSVFKPDFYTSNLHKWFYVPRPSGVLYVDPKYHNTVQPMPIGHTYYSPKEQPGEDLLLEKFSYVSSSVFGGVASVPAAIEFRKNVCGGEAAISEYCFTLARKVGDLVVKKWPGSYVMENKDSTQSTAMINIVFPIHNYVSNFDFSSGPAFSDYLKIALLDQYNTLAPIQVYKNKVIVRFSCQVYNELSDYEYACEAIHKTVQSFFEKH
ncbi:Aminotransferase class-V family protein [Clavispora lusitaniae]|uniref:Aminotransferase class V domain-containing protein n=1 Tax=Clavispora lusitaniae (strain ATCC 42720) TaxID=306902 RepID=C4Y5F5_CLAL4|nr:uncharacterized protein CLUG_03389 [Clavispora lusitaniae ATCC 42720]EEQ39261.1 hypothetical protein CLUG_03389 [Clavispora lusitaniae ATCC 42720]KAF7582759.1 Aminotransferase class-V family protein [Clavispora lusitaniae]